MCYENFYQLDRDLEVLFDQKKFEERLLLLERPEILIPIEEYEKHWFTIMCAKASCYRHLGRHQEEFDTYIDIVEKGYPCFSPYINDLPFKGDKRYENLKEKNTLLLNELRRDSKMEYKIFLPEGYRTDHKYPVFILLHGSGDNIDNFINGWKPDLFLNRGFLVIYIQSSQLIQYRGYSWFTDRALARHDIKECYDIISRNYSIDENCVILGGFSDGAIESVDLTMSNTIPASGFICLCTVVKPDSFTPESVLDARSRGVRGVFMEGENEMPVPAEEEMINVFKNTGFSFEFYVNEGVGEIYPEDFSEKLEKALDFIVKK